MMYSRVCINIKIVSHLESDNSLDRKIFTYEWCHLYLLYYSHRCNFVYLIDVSEVSRYRLYFVKFCLCLIELVWRTDKVSFSRRILS